MAHEYKFIDVPVNDPTTLNELAASGWELFRVYNAKVKVTNDNSWMAEPSMGNPHTEYEVYRCILQKEIQS